MTVCSILLKVLGLLGEKYESPASSSSGVGGTGWFGSLSIDLRGFENLLEFASLAFKGRCSCVGPELEGAGAYVGERENPTFFTGLDSFVRSEAGVLFGVSVLWARFVISFSIPANAFSTSLLSSRNSIASLTTLATSRGGVGGRVGSWSSLECEGDMISDPE